MIHRGGYGRDVIRKVLRIPDPQTNGAQQPPVGLIAGWGSFPVEVAQEIVMSGRRVCCVAINDHASPELETICDHVKWMGVGKLGGHLRYFQRWGVREATMAGKLFKSELLFQGSVWLKHFPDLTAIRTFGPCLLGKQPDSRDDSLLLAVTKTFANRSIDICPATDFAPELLVNQGLLAGKPLSAKQLRDAEFGWQVAKQMGEWTSANRSPSKMGR